MSDLKSLIWDYQYEKNYGTAEDFFESADTLTAYADSHQEEVGVAETADRVCVSEARKFSCVKK